MAYKPTPDQLRAADPEASVWVSASAGTGKTGILISRLLRLFLSGTQPEKILCITFTKAAAAEITQRLHTIAMSWAIAPQKTLVDALGLLLDRAPRTLETRQARQLMSALLKIPGGLRIMTIHAFCQSVLSRFPLEAGVPPKYTVIDDTQALSLLKTVWDNLYEQPSSDLWESLLYLQNALNEDSQDTIIQDILSKRSLIQKIHRHFQTPQQYQQALEDALVIPHGLNTDTLTATFLHDVSIPSLQAATEAFEKTQSKTRHAQAVIFKKFIADPVDHISSYIGSFLTDKGTINQRLLSGLKDTDPVIAAFVEKEAERVYQYHHTLIKIQLRDSTQHLMNVAFHIEDAYQKTKTQHGYVDYDDQINFTAQLLDTTNGTAWVQYKLDYAIDHILVDEAQDTSPEQWSVIQSLSTEFFTGLGLKGDALRTLFVVGDEKQSIFSFQKADPESFNTVRHILREKARDQNTLWHDIPLQYNFRSSALILTFVDTIFSDQALHKSITHDVHPITHKAFNELKPGSVTIMPLIENPDDTSILPHIQAGIIADDIQQKLSGKNLFPGITAIKPSDILILCRTRSNTFYALAKELKKRNIPVSGSDRVTLADEISVQDCLNALQFTLNPFDDYAFACFLKSPFMRYTEQQLFDLSYNRSDTKLIDRFYETAPSECAEYVRHVQKTGKNQKPSRFFHYLLNTLSPGTGQSGQKALAQSIGYHVHDILQEFLNSVLSFEEQHPPSPYGFMHWFYNAALEVKRQTGSKEQPNIRMMTVHGSKGLEAPVVYLIDAHSKPLSYKSNQSVLWTDDTLGFLWGQGDALINPFFQQKKEAFLKLQYDEYYRLLYVALTRPESHLVVCGLKMTEKHSHYPSWYHVITDGIARVNHPDYSLQISEKNIRSLMFTPQQNKTEDTVAPTSRLAIPDYFYERPVDSEKIKDIYVNPSDLIKEKLFSASPLDRKEYDLFKRGRVIHTLLQTLLKKPPQEYDALMSIYLARHVSDASESDHIKHEINALLNLPDFSILLHGHLQTEAVISGTIALDGIQTPVSGKIDFLSITGSVLTVIDFKTNRYPPSRKETIPESYLFQIRCYKNLLQQLYPEHDVKTGILYTAQPRLFWVDV